MEWSDGVREGKVIEEIRKRLRRVGKEGGRRILEG